LESWYPIMYSGGAYSEPGSKEEEDIEKKKEVKISQNWDEPPQTLSIPGARKEERPKDDQ